MDKKDAQDYTQDVLLTDALVRVKTLESLLVNKGIFTREEYQEQMGIVTAQIAKAILEKAQVPGNLDDLIKSFQKNQN